MKLRIAPGLDLPEEAATQTFGVLAKRGSGKSNAAAVMAEEMYRVGLPFVVVDPVGAWWGLRSADDGKGPGLAVPILGGHRGDVPLSSGGGAEVADLVAEENASLVLDVSDFESETAKRRFLADFAERLFRAKGRPGRGDPLHLFLEEADDYAPQKATREGARTLGAFQRIVKQGRARGLGATMISQRSAVLNKDLLTQIETLVVLRTTSPQDRKAIAGWVEYHGQRDEMLASLSDLRPGEAWVWSPWLGVTERVQFPRRRTFDSAATPKAGARRTVATLADVDLDALRERMATAIEQAEQLDPRALRRRVAELERALREEQARTVVATPVERIIEVERVVEVPTLSAEARQMLTEIAYEMETVEKAAASFGSLLSDVATRVVEKVEHVRSLNVRAPTAGVGTEGEGRSSRRSAVMVPSVPEPPSPARTAATTDGPSRSQQRVLDALAWLEALGIDGRRVRVAFLSGYRPGGRFHDVVSSCRTAGWLDYPGDGVVALTLQGRGLANPADVPRTVVGFQDAVRSKLNASQRRVLDPLIASYPDALSREQLASASGYEVGGRFHDVVSSIRTLGIVDYPDKGHVVALPVLFLER